ncbi:glycerol-3-phosphate acyltransferase 1, mitochondrial isoform X2 [Culicoides brevitarsis]
MLDALQARANELWRTEPRNPGDMFSSNNSRTAHEQIRKELAQKKDRQKKMLESELFNIKEKPVSFITPPSKYLTGLSCKFCAPGNSESQLDPSQKRRDVIDILKVTKHAGWRPNASKYDWGTWCPHMAQSLRLKSYNYPQVSQSVMQDERMRTAIRQAAKDALEEKKQKLSECHTENDDDFDETEYYDNMLNFNENRAKKLLAELRSAVSEALLRTTSWVLYKLLPMFLSGVAAHPAHIEMLKAASNKMPNVPMIFLPLHRSHLDYILVTFILCNNDMRAPLVAAGNNLNITFFGRLLRGLGAFFIKRKIDPVAGKKDVVYRGLLHTYMQKALVAGHDIEFFIEGGRTRTGKPCMPKSGVLSVIIDACMDHTIPDALLVPVSINYEKLVDGNFVYEQLGQKKKPETFKSAISAIWKTLNSQYGLMRIDFNEPFSLRELVNSFSKTNEIGSRTGNRHLLQHNLSTSSLYGTDVVQEEHRVLVDRIARHVVYDCASATSIMTTNALAFLLLTQFRDGAPLSVLVEAMNCLRDDVSRGNRDIGFTGTSEDVILYAANLLGPSTVTIEKWGGQTFIRPVTIIPNVIELYYYANTVVPFYALDSVIVTVANNLAKLRQNNGSLLEDVGVSEDEICEISKQFCDIFRYEFIFCKPCQNFNTVLLDAISTLSDKNIVRKPMIEVTEEETRANRIAKFLENDNQIDLSDNSLSDDENANVWKRSLCEKQNIFLPAEKHCDRIVLMTVLAPITHTYLSVAKTLHHLVGCNSIIENEFISKCVQEITYRLKDGNCKFGESISTDSIRNCIKLFEKWNIVDISTSTGARLLSLNPIYNSVAGVRQTVDRINRFIPL